jgi:hypothetical protein
VNSCGNTCTVCPSQVVDGGTAAHSHPVCSAAGECGVACDDGYHNCAGPTANPTCVSNYSVNSCGSSSCTTCTSPSNGTATCLSADGGVCGFTCDSAHGYQQCGDPPSCLLTCGTNCSNPCTTAVDNATPTCTGSTCGFTCITGYDPCGGGCVPTGTCTPDAGH